MFAVALAALTALAVQAAAQGQWNEGRATYYGLDGWSIHTGSCGYGYLDEKAGTGWDVAAAADTNPDYKNSCGKCREIKCKPIDFKDGYGQWLHRKDVCHDPDASVVVTIVDTCPCSYPGNWYSNKRWCCGDMYHIDVSIWTFEKLTDLKWGVIALSWREVPCWYTPKKAAKHPWGTKQGAERGPPRGDWKAWMDKRPYNEVRMDSGRRLRGANTFER
jgi:hypothetical protein